MSSATETRAVVEKLLGRIAVGDEDGIAALYATRSDWRVNWPEAEHDRDATPWITHRGTGAEAGAHFRQIAEHHVPEGADTTVDTVLVDGVDAVVFGVIRQTARTTGRSYAARFALRLTVENGLVTRHHVYEDSLAVAQAFAAD